jgi:hypothetical protein
MPQRDQFPARAAGGSPREWFTITPDDNADLPQIPQAIWVGTGGDIALMGSDGQVKVFKNAQAGTYLVASPVRVMGAGSGTTASNLLGVV